MITMQQVNNEDKYFVEHTFVIVSVKKIDKKMSNEKYFKVKTKFLSQTMKFIKE